MRNIPQNWAQDVMGSASLILIMLSWPAQCIAQAPAIPLNPAVPPEILVRIVAVEDQRRWDSDLQTLITDQNAAVRRRAVLGAGRIGEAASVLPLGDLLDKDADEQVRQMAAFALGEIESVTGSDVLLAMLRKTNESPVVRARAVEALGKISAALSKEEEKQKLELNSAILVVLKSELEHRSEANKQTVLLALTATLRANAVDAGPAIAEFLSHPDARIRADAANALARLRLKDGGPKLRELLKRDPDPVVRANAARALGAAADKEAFDALLDRAVNDSDLRVRVSAVRALASVNDTRASQPLLNRAAVLSNIDLRNRPSEANELLELAATLGRLLQATDNQPAIQWLRRVRPAFEFAAPELEIAYARISPLSYLQDLGADLPAAKRAQKLLPVQWRAGTSLAQGLKEIAGLPPSAKDRDKLGSQAQGLLRSMLAYRNAGLKLKTMVMLHSEYAIPEILRALAAFKPADLGELLRTELRAEDVIIRSTAADLLGELPPDQVNERALTETLGPSLHDTMNDAALSILDSLGKQKTVGANEAVKTAIASNDHLVRRRAIQVLKANGGEDLSARIGLVKTENTNTDYARALARSLKNIRASVTTTKGTFVIDLFAEQAPLTVDNFVRLAQRGFFNGQAIPRVVPNFVVQAGDPRGDQNGGPGYQIRCEINELPYERAAVGMALSGKDTGGSQWFVTHSPQPHLDGGYTVFGRVVAGMDVVDSIVRGDLIRRVTITERP